MGTWLWHRTKISGVAIVGILQKGLKLSKSCMFNGHYGKELIGNRFFCLECCDKISL